MRTASSKAAAVAAGVSPVAGIGHDIDVEDLRRETRRILTQRFPVRRLREAIEQPPDRRMLDERAELGWSGALVPTEHGGGGARLLHAVAISEEHGRALFAASLEATAAVTSLLQSPLVAASRAALLRDIAGGATAVAWVDGASAPAASADALLATPSAGGVRLRGSVDAVHDAGVADVIVVSAPRENARGLVHAVVAADDPGVERRMVRFFDLSRRHWRVDLRDVDVSAANLIDDPEALGHRRMRAVATVLTCADASGAARHLTEMTVAYASHRTVFGRPVASYQAIKHRCADMLLAVEGAETVTRWAALAVDSADPGEATAVSVAKAFVSDAATAVAGESQQIHAGIGFTWEHDLHLYVRRIKADALLHGSAAAHRAAVATALVTRVTEGRR